jgi:hypothetical protein
VWWHTPVIPAKGETEMRGSRFKAGPGKKYKTLSENKLKHEGLGAWIKVVESFPSNQEA